MKSLFMLKKDLDDVLVKVDKIVKTEYPASCKECAKIIHSKEIQDIWMDLFLLIINICESSMKFGKEKDEKSVETLDGYVKSIMNILDHDLIRENIPDLYKVGLDNYLPGVLVKQRDSDTLESINVRILKMKKRL